jgi:hypothetical protein
MQKFISVPFSVDAMHGLSKVEGVAKFSSAGIVLEFEAKILGLMQTGVKEVRLPKVDLMDVKLKSGVFDSKLERMLSTKLEIRLNNFAKFSELPYENGKVSLKIKRQDRERAENALQLLEAELIDENQLPLTSVNELFDKETKQLN